MPYFSDETDRQRDRGRGGFVSDPPAQFPEDTQLREYSDDMDMSALGELLGGEPFSFGEPDGSQPEGDWRDEFVPPPEPPMPESLPEPRRSLGSRIASAFASLKERMPRGKKKKNDSPQNEVDGSGFDFQYDDYGDISDSGGESFFDDTVAPAVEETDNWQTYSDGGGEPSFDDTVAPTVEGTDDWQDFSESGWQDGSEGEPDFSATVPEKQTLPARAAAFFAPVGVKITGFFAGVFGKKKKASAVPNVPEMPDDPNFISDTVSFVDAQEEESGDNNWSDGFSRENDNWNQSDIPGETYAPYQEDFPREFTEEEEPDAVSAPDGDEMADEPETAAPENIREYGIMAGVRRRLAAFRKRLPSFRPKDYTIPEPVYEPEEDNIKSPSLAKDIERYIAREQDLGEVQREFEKMQGFIRGVDTDVGLREGDVAPPPQMKDVRAAERELFDLIDSIDRQNEEQRGRIGVYDEPPEQDPYNYRGINDERQYYTDIEATTFSLQPSVSFESERRVNPGRRAAEQAYSDEMRRHLEGDPVNRLGEQTFSLPVSSQPPAAERYDRRAPAENYDDGFERRRRQSEPPVETRRSVGTASRAVSRNGREEAAAPPLPSRGFHRRGENRGERAREARQNSPLSAADSELADDFDSQFHPRRTAPRSPKSVKVRRRD